MNVVETEKDWDMFLNLQKKILTFNEHSHSQFIDTLAFNSHRMNYYLTIYMVLLSVSYYYLHK